MNEIAAFLSALVSLLAGWYLWRLMLYTVYNTIIYDIQKDSQRRYEKGRRELSIISNCSKVFISLSKLNFFEVVIIESMMLNKHVKKNTDDKNIDKQCVDWIVSINALTRIYIVLKSPIGISLLFILFIFRIFKWIMPDIKFDNFYKKTYIYNIVKFINEMSLSGLCGRA